MSYYDEIMRKAAEKANMQFGIENEGDYYVEVDGWQLLHCHKCQKPKQTIMFIGGYSYEELQVMFEDYAIKQPKASRAEVEKAVMSQRPPKNRRRDIGLVGVPCKCQLDYQEGVTKAEKDDERRKRIHDNKYKCFPVAELQRVTFDKYESNKHIEACKRYAQKFGEMRKEGKGMILCGRAGAGKTIASICLANALLDREYRIGFKVQAEITYIDVQNRNELINELLGYTLLIIDDFNLQYITDYGRDILFFVIDSRIKANKPTVLTSNISKEGLMNPPNNIDKRICERLGDGNSFYIIENSANNYRKRNENGISF